MFMFACYCHHVLSTPDLYAWYLNVVFTRGIHTWHLYVEITRGIYTWYLHVVFTRSNYTWYSRTHWFYEPQIVHYQEETHA
jgi:hypothetical protein